MAFALLDHTEEKTTINEILTGTFREKDRQINFAIEELEYLKANIRFQGYYDERIEDLIDTQISVLKGDNSQKSESDDSNIQTFDSFHGYWNKMANSN